MIKFISDSMDERIKSPVLKPFYASWILINWKFLITLALSNNPISQRIVAADHYMSIWTGLYLPLIATAIYIIAYPWATCFVSWLQRKPKELQRLQEIKSENKFLAAKQANQEKQKEVIETEKDIQNKLNATIPDAAIQILILIDKLTIHQELEIPLEAIQNQAESELRLTAKSTSNYLEYINKLGFLHKGLFNSKLIKLNAEGISYLIENNLIEN